jgi:hypothetical protein
VRWVGHATCIAEMRNLGRCELHSSGSGQGPVEGSYKRGNKCLGSINGGEFLDQTSILLASQEELCSTKLASWLVINKILRDISVEGNSEHLTHLYSYEVNIPINENTYKAHMAFCNPGLFFSLHNPALYESLHERGKKDTHTALKLIMPCFTYCLSINISVQQQQRKSCYINYVIWKITHHVITSHCICKMSIVKLSLQYILAPYYTYNIQFSTLDAYS